MEQVRLLLAIGLSFLVLFVWSVFFVDKGPVTENPADQKAQPPVTETEPKKQTAAVEQTPSAEQTASFSKDQVGAVQETPAIAPASRQITVETPIYTVRISTKGATFTSYVLKNYRESVEKDAPNKELVPQTLKNGVIRTSLANNSLKGLEDAVYSVDSLANQIAVTEKPQSLVFRWVADDGNIITKTYTFDPKSYLIDLNVKLNNASTATLNDQLELSIRAPVEQQNRYGFVGPSGLINDKLEQIKIKKIEEKDKYPGTIKWIGIEDRYFISSILPDSESEGTMSLSVNDDVITNQLINPAFEIPPGNQKDFNFYVFMGPKSMSVLNSLGHGMGKALNFGFFNIIAQPCLWLLIHIHNVIPNYGIAIILLTIFTKVILWPLGNKSYKSMSEMKKLQPLMTEIREKYKDDKQKMNQELMALYRTYKVNPMGGCLPMVLQIPVFFALYRMLYQAIELRHAPFFLWINDLSAPDRLFHFGFSIPFMEPPYGIPVLTIIMGATMLLQQKMSPPPGDPTQAKMMMLMPVVFTFIFINFSSGLVLYWLVNNILSISQQYYVQKKST